MTIGFVVSGNTEPVEQLPRGRHGLSRRQVVANQRDRLSRAIDALILRGPAPSVHRASEIAGVGRKTFYELWPNIQAAVDERAGVLAQQPSALPGRAGDVVRALLAARVGVMDGNIEAQAQRLLAVLPPASSVLEQEGGS